MITKRKCGRPARGTELQIPDDVVARVIAENPGGASQHDIAAALGCTRQAVQQIELSAMRSLAPKARKAGLSMMHRPEAVTACDFGEVGYTGDTGGLGNNGWDKRREPLPLDPCDHIAGLMAQLDAIHERAKRASLVLGVMREDARWCEAWGDAAE